MVKKLFWVFLLLLNLQSLAYAQIDSGKPVTVTGVKNAPARATDFLDSIANVQQHKEQDSLKKLSDSLSLLWIKKPDPNRPNRFVDSLFNLYKVDKLDFASWAKKFPRKAQFYSQGKPRLKGETWVMLVILFLVLFLGIIKLSFSKELSSIFHSFYSNRVLSQISKEDTMLSSWPFLFLYILLGLTLGMFLYLSGKYFQLQYALTGFEWFLVLSAIVLGLFTLKILVLRLLGFFFGIEKMVREYVAILYLSYFNAALIFLPIIIAYSLTPYRFAEVYNYLAMGVLLLIFAVQFIRAGANIFFSYQFPKIYLIIYLCALEICPLIILVKALRF